MAQRPDTEDYRSLFLADVPMMDMRAPSEFSQGSFPSARNLPLMSDEERAEVGTCYKHSGQSAAISLGHQLVSGDTRRSRMLHWLQFARDYPEGYLYCFRGGLRSSTVQQWLRESGIDYPLVRGGYKAMRQFLLGELEQSLRDADFVLIAGKTGTGKTRVISQLPGAIDLEGLAGHRGSTFGQLLEPQPSQIDFENGLAIELMKLLAQGQGKVFLEDEGHLIGRRSLPGALGERMREAPMLVVEQSMEERVDVVIEDYVVDLGERFGRAYGPDGPTRHCRKLQDDLFRIRKRLGGERHTRVSAMIDSAFARQWQEGDYSLHRQWIVELLGGYYDPMYEFQLQKRGGKILYRGNRQEVVAQATALA
jgi:tRNA 2-selenouridine synthase